MFCPRCGNQAAPYSAFCSSCGSDLPSASAVVQKSPIVRPRQPRMIAGVCSGLAIHYGWDVALVRVLFVVIACLTSGCATLFYIAAWILIPEAPYALPPAQQRPANTNLTVA